MFKDVFKHIILKSFMALWTSTFITALLGLTVYFLLYRTRTLFQEYGIEWGLDFNRNQWQVVDSWRMWVYGAKDKYVSHGIGCVGITIGLFLGID